jgi:hypothetical protein
LHHNNYNNCDGISISFGDFEMISYEEYLENCKEFGFEVVNRDEWYRIDSTTYTPNMSNRTYIFPGGHVLEFTETLLRADQVYPFYVMACVERMRFVGDLMAMKKTITSLVDSIQDHISKLP